MQPPALKFKNAIFRNQYGTETGPWAFKRVTHAEGWMVVLVSQVPYFMYFENAGHLTNISYNGEYFELEVSNFIYCF